MQPHLANLLLSGADRSPDAPLLTFVDPCREPVTITAAQLDRDARRIAVTLHQLGVKRGDIVPLMFEHGYDLIATFWGGIYCGAIPSVLPYISREAPSKAYLEQTKRLARFTGATTLVTQRDLEETLREGLADSGCRIFGLPPSNAADVQGPVEAWTIPPPSDPPFIQFSSGTTGIPKGVVVTHAAVLYYARTTTADFKYTPDDVNVGWLPLYHDMGLMSEILQPMVTSSRSVLMSPAAWLHEPHLLFRMIDHYRASITWMPNFAFRYCIRRVRDDQIEGLDLSSCRILGNASEPVLHEDLEAFLEKFGRRGLRREALKIAYGLAEHIAAATWSPNEGTIDVDWVSESELGQGRAVPAEPGALGSRALVSCGYPAPAVELRIVDDTGRDLPERQVGEIILRSPCVFLGYYSMPEETAAALRGGWLYTGDLAYVADGQLYVCGRKKDLIVVGGRNLHPVHLEATAAAVLAERAQLVAAFGVPNPGLGTETPVLVCEMRGETDPATSVLLRQQVREEIRRQLEIFVGDVYLVDKGWIVRASSGKINRAATRDKYLAESAVNESPAAAVEGAAASQATATELKLVRIWRALFKQASIALDEDFFALGGDSLLAAELMLEIEDQLRIRLPATALLESPTISGLARLIDRGSAAPQPTLVPLQPGKHTRPALFCVHGLGGGVIDYRALSQALGMDQPSYGLLARGVDGIGPIDTSIQAMAAHYAQTVKEFQPAGPYYLSGYCFGGIVAFEMARQMTAAGDEVALVAVLEGYAPIGEAQRASIWREWRMAGNFARTLPYWIRDYMQLGSIARQARNRRLLRVARKRLKRLAGVAVEFDASDILDATPSQPVQLQRLLESHVAAVRRYSPAPYAGRLVLFRTAERLLESPSRDRGWNALSSRGVEVQMISGSHATILQQPHVELLAKKLRAYLP